MSKVSKILPRKLREIEIVLVMFVKVNGISMESQTI